MLSLFLPDRCVACDAAHTPRRKPEREVLEWVVCSICRRMLDHAPIPPEDHITEMTAIPGADCFENRRSAFYYTETSPIYKIIHAFKYEDMPRLAFEAGRLIRKRMPEVLRDIDVVLPVPLHRTRYAERGYNQAEELAKGLAEEELTISNAVQRIRPTPTQTSLSLAERIENVRGAFALKPSAWDIEGKRVLIIDDVMTTGSTIASVAETLRIATPAWISSLTLALAAPTDSKQKPAKFSGGF